MYDIQIHRNKLDGDYNYDIILGGSTIGKFNFIPMESLNWHEIEHEKKFCVLLDKIELEAGFRGKGIGTSVLKKILKRFNKLGFKFVYLVVDFDNEIAQHIYTKLGFKFTGEIIDYLYEMVYEL